MPETVCNLTGLINLSIRHNQLTGSLPTCLYGANPNRLPELRYLSLDHNRLTGTLPEVIVPNNKLEELWLDSNGFDGTIPQSFGQFAAMRRMRLGGNRLAGSVPLSLCTQMLRDPNSPGELTLTYNKLEIWEPDVLACLANLWGSNLQLGLTRQLVLTDSLTVQNVSSNNITLNWTPLDWPEVLTYTIEYSALGITQTQSITGSGKVENLVLSNLQPETTYHVSLRASALPGVVGIDEASSRPIVTTVTTPKSPPPVIPTQTVSPTVAQPGDEVTYLLTFYSAATATNLVGAAPLPESVEYVRDSLLGPAYYDAQAHAIRYSIPQIPAGQTLLIQYRGKIAGSASDGSVLFSDTTTTSGGETYRTSVAVAVKAPQPADTLMLIYANGDNSLSEHVRHLFQKAEKGLYAGRESARRVEVLLLYDGLDDSDAYLYRLKPDDNLLENCPTMTNPDCGGRYVDGVDRWPWGENTGAASSVEEFLGRTIGAYADENTTVVLSLVGHGGGWSPNLLGEQPSGHDEKPDSTRFFGSFLFDRNPGSGISTRELALVLERVAQERGKKIDLLYFDACLMGMLEVLYDLRDSVRYALASESTSWTAFRYDRHIEDLFVEPRLGADEIGRKWISNELAELGGKYPATYSLVDLSQMGAVLAQQSELADALNAGLRDSTAHATVLSSVKAAADAARCFDQIEDRAIDSLDNYCDLKSFADNLAAQFSSTTRISLAAQALRQAIAAAVIAEHHVNAVHPTSRNEYDWGTEGELGGISVFLTRNTDDWRRAFYNATYVQTAAEGTWDEFLVQFAESAPVPPPASCVIGSAGCEQAGPEATDPTTPTYGLYLPVVSR
ncbi:MAG: fibronectin type III domain-containing protein [Caldilinea sp.]|nr:fibronectin type III domain-containing protein [Caldilinea sp.]